MTNPTPPNQDTGVVLKACPFPHEVKRGPFVEFDTEDFGFVRVSCGDCGCAGPFVPLADGITVRQRDEDEAVTLWNTRTPENR